MPVPLLRRRRARRLLMAVATAAALSGVPTIASAAPPLEPRAAAPSATAATCTTEHGAARVRAGKAGIDPNDLTLPQTVASQHRYEQALVAAGLSKDLTKLPVPSVTVPIRYHVITRDDGTGAPTRAQLQQQVDVLNAGYGGRTASQDAKTIFKFTVASVDVTRNSDWYDWSVYTDDDDVVAKKALHVGGKKALNVYVTGLADGLLGYSTFPDEPKLFEDGVVILTDSLPGGGAVPYNEGDTLAHEVGHWLGLYHTFENGCAGPGDEVPDTPYQADGDNIFFCNESDDTCAQPGRDPVHNFMSYGDDPCLDRFSRGQSLRMGLAWLAFRSGLKF